MRSVQTLALADALLAIAAGQASATEQGVCVSIAVVDCGGALVALQTMDDTQPAGAEVAHAKARAAALFRRPSAAFEEVAAQLNKPSVMFLPFAVPHALPVQGGLPVHANEAIVGAVGVSGGSGAQDAEVAQRAVEAVGRTANAGAKR